MINKQGELSDKIVNFFKNYWQWLAVAVIVAIGIWIRVQPLKNLQCLEGMLCLQALDPYYIYRQTLYLIENSFHVMPFDYFKYFPVGAVPYNNYQMTYYIPATLFVMVHSVFSSLTFMTFAQWYPAVLGGLFAVPMYLIGRELYNKYVGVLSAALLIFSQSVLYRTSAGFFEKEATSGLIMLFVIFFFVRATNNKSYLSAIISGLLLAIMSLAWNGAGFLVIILSLFTVFSIFFKPDNKFIERQYLIFVLIGVVCANFLGFPNVALNMGSSISMLCFGICLLIILKTFVFRFYGVSEDKKFWVYPILSLVGGVSFLILSLFIKTFATTTNYFLSFIFGKRDPTGTLSVVSTTVAENSGATFGDIFARMNTAPASNALSQFALIDMRLSINLLFILVMLVVLVNYMFYRKEKKDLTLLAVIFVSFLTYLYLVKDFGASFKVGLFDIYVFMIFGVITLAYTLIENRRVDAIFPIIWIATALIGSLTRIRIIFFIGPAAALIGAFLLYKIFVYLMSLDVKKLSVGRFKVSWIPVAIGLYLVFVFSTNIGAGYVFTSAVGPSFNNNWQESMQWVQDNTAEDTVLMSWWDYGYWFQSGGRRFTMADGGNNNESRNYELANFFTGSNATEWIPFLDEHSVDYIVVDYTLIGKYSAMSKIGSLGYNVESFVGLGRPVRTLSKDGKTIYKKEYGNP